MSLLLKLLIALLALYLMTLTLEEHRVHAAQDREAVAALQTANAIAERDSTRDVARENARVAALAGDSIRIVEKRAVQVAQQKDLLDRALGGERRARFELTARIDSVRRVATARVREDSGVRRATFAVRDPPYTIAADVAIPPPPDTGRMSVDVALDPIAMTARLRCTAPDEHGVRAASVVVSTPPWASVRLAQVEQAPDVCAAIGARAARSARIAFRGPLMGVGIVAAPGASPRVGYFIGAGLVLRP